MKKTFLTLCICTAMATLFLCGCHQHAPGHNHDLIGTKIVKEATCTKVGEWLGTCRICNQSVTTSYGPLPHEWDNNHRCSVCGTAEDDRGLSFTSHGDGTCSVKYEGNCTAERVEIPVCSPSGDRVTEIADSAFRACERVREIVIPEGVTKIGPSAFANCTGLMSLHLPDSMQHIGSFAFSGCTSLHTVSFSPGLRTIDNSAFVNCLALQSITLFNNLKSIGTNAFRSCSALADIHLPNKNIFIDCGAFHGTGFYNDPSNWEEGVLYIGRFLYYTKMPGLPEHYTVREDTIGIGGEAFFCRSIKSISLPESLRYIGTLAFGDCTELSDIVFPTGLRSIGTDAFRNCISLENVTFSEGLETIGAFAFDGCTNLRSVHLPDSLQSIGNNAFALCTGVVSITLPQKPLDIGQNAFAATPYYENSTHWENGVLYFGKHLLATQSLYLPPKYDVKEGTLSIAEGSFSNARLDTLTIPASVKHIADDAFPNSTIENLYLSDIAVWCRASFTGQKFGITRIFLDNILLQELVIPEEVTEVGSRAFMGCLSLRSVRFHAGVTHVGKDAFRYCDNISELHFADIDQWMSIDVEHIDWVESYCIDEIASAKRQISLYANGKPVTHLDIPEHWTEISANNFSIFVGIVETVTSVKIGQNMPFARNMKYYDDWNGIVYYEGPRIVNGFDIGYPEYYLPGTVYYYSEVVPPADKGHYWHYVNGVPVPWPTPSGEESGT